jgi:tetratricopeptide (TPR) repeat protein
MKRILVFSLILGIYLLYALTSCNNQSSDQKEVASADSVFFVGNEACRSCHVQEHNDWLDSDHYKAMLPANDSTVLGDFNNAELIADGVTTRLFKREGEFFIHTQGEDGAYHEYKVLYTFGFFPLQQYLTALPGGKMQASRVSWDAREKKWFHQYAGQKIHHRDWIHWTGNGQNWNTMCASCHSTDLQKNYDADKDTYRTTWKDINVSCESCHGPGSSHLKLVKSADYKPGHGVLNSGFIYSKDTISALQLNTCAPCHARKSDIAQHFIRSSELLDDLIPQVISNEFYFADGQIKEEDYEYGSFAQSKMFHNNVRCSNCHNSHSGKLKLEGNAMCTSCHESELNSPAHHFHKQNTSAAQCISCHMPERTYMGVDHRRDHSFRIPRPDQSVKYATPNTCNSCHQEKSAKWAADAIVKWYGPKRTYHFSDDLLPGSLLNDQSETHLIILLKDLSQPEIARATAASYLASIITQPSADALLTATKDSKAQVRYQAIRALENFPPDVWLNQVSGCLSDKVRAVRIAAADLYHRLPKDQLPPSISADYNRAALENLNYLHYQQDFAVGNVMLADYTLQDGDQLNAIRYYIRGLQKDSLMNYARLNLASAYNGAGKNMEALRTLQEAASIDPRNERIYYNLGLLNYEMQDIPSALSNFRKSVSLGSINPGLYYNYGLLLQQQGSVKEAETILLRGSKLAPQASNINYALAYLYLQKNQPETAKKYGLILQQTDPANPQYSELFRQLGI